MYVQNLKDTFFMILLWEKDKPQFALREVQYICNHLPQAYKNPPTIAHSALAKILKEIKVLDGVSMYDQYIDDTLIGVDNQEVVREVSSRLWDTLTSLGLELPQAKCQGPSQEINFLVGWWLGGAMAILVNISEKNRSW